MMRTVELEDWTQVVDEAGSRALAGMAVGYQEALLGTSIVPS